MKHLLLSLLTLTSSLLTLSAAVPLRWTVETSRATPAQFEAYQGETLALEAALQSYGKPLEAPSSYSLYWQTNGMGNAWWSTNCTTNYQLPSTNLLRATWTPSMETGAKVYNCFIGQPGTIYHAAFQLRLRPSPGATPNELPLPQKVIDFAKVTVLNPPWSGGGGGGVDTNAVLDIIHKTVDGSARPLPRYLHALDFDDSYPEAAKEYYRSRGDGKTDGGCSAVRRGGYLYRNFDFPFDDRAEFVVKMSAGVQLPTTNYHLPTRRFASVGVAQVGTNLTEAIVTSGKPSRCYKWLPGATVDGINENGVVCEINVVDTEPPRNRLLSADIHPLAAVRWALDNGTSAQMVATNLASRILWPSGWKQNFHWMVADERETWIVENGTASNVTAVAAKRVMTNFEILPDTYSGMGAERYNLLLSSACCITNAWYTRAYQRETNPPWVSDLAEVLAYTNYIFNVWAAHDKEYFRGQQNGGKPWWQTVHTSIYDITNRTLRVAVQETDDWYTIAVPGATGVSPDAVRKIVEPMIGATTNALGKALRAEIDAHEPADYAAVSNASIWASNEVSNIAAKLTQFSDWSFTGRDVPKYNNLSVEYIDQGGYYMLYNNGESLGSSESGDLPGDLLVIDGFWNSQGRIDIIATRQKFIAALDPAFSNRLETAATLANTINSTVLTFDTWGEDGYRELWIESNAPYVAWPLSFFINVAFYNKISVNSFDDIVMNFGEKTLPDYLASGEWNTDPDDPFATVSQLPVISAEDPTFSNEVATVARSVLPTVVRAYDNIRHCWWVLEMVNGVPTWTVED